MAIQISRDKPLQLRPSDVNLHQQNIINKIKNIIITDSNKQGAQSQLLPQGGGRTASGEAPLLASDGSDEYFYDIASPPTDRE